jgi:predicted nucleic acid-binding protein
MLIPLLGAVLPLSAGELGAPTVAKFIRVILLSSGGRAVTCADKEIAGELGALGVALEADAKLVWADSEKDVARQAKAGKLVVCGTKGLLASGAALALVAEGGHPVIYLHAKHLAATGMTLPDNILKLAKAAQ